MYYEQTHEDISDLLTHFDNIFNEQGWSLIDDQIEKRVYEGDGVTIIFEVGYTGAIYDGGSVENEYTRFRQIRINVIENGSYLSTLSNIYEHTTGITNTDFNLTSGGNPGFLIENKNNKTFISIDSNRMIMAFLQNGKYQTLYVGNYLPYADPSQHENPHCYVGNIVGEGYSTSNNTDDIFKMGSIMADAENSYGVSSFVKRWDNVWLSINDSGGEDGEKSGIYPFIGSSGNRQFMPNIDGSYTAIPAVIVSDNNNNQSWNTGGYLFGELDGVFGVSGFYQSPENTFNYNNEEYICFPSLSYSQSNRIYIAIKKA